MLVHKLGAPFVRAMVDEKHLVKFYEFERSGKLNLIVFILFLIPGMPKDVFTYLVPLTNMRMRAFLVLSTVGRIPGVIISTYAAAGLADGDITTSLIIFGIAAVLMILGIVFRDKIMRVLGTQRALHEMDKEREEKQAEEILRESLQQEDEKRASNMAAGNRGHSRILRNRNQGALPHSHRGALPSPLKRSALPLCSRTMPPRSLRVTMWRLGFWLCSLALSAFISSIWATMPKVSRCSPSLLSVAFSLSEWQRGLFGLSRR